KGQKQVGAISSGERGKNTTVCYCINALGAYVPPMFIFARQRITPQLSKNGPPKSLYECSKNGWITEKLFIVWLKHFCKFSNPSKENPLLLIIDNHTTHVSLSAYNFCKL
ncbi:DDE 1 domain containing protein, partial [Asbolus verrucosus]